MFCHDNFTRLLSTHQRDYCSYLSRARSRTSAGVWLLTFVPREPPAFFQRIDMLPYVNVARMFRRQRRKLVMAQFILLRCQSDATVLSLPRPRSTLWASARTRHVFRGLRTHGLVPEEYVPGKLIPPSQIRILRVKVMLFTSELVITT